MVFHDAVDTESSTELTLASKEEPSFSSSGVGLEVSDVVDDDVGGNARAVAVFDRCEIDLGKQIGEGSFSKVYEIRGFQLGRGRRDDDCCQYYSPEEQEVRQEYCQQQQQRQEANGRYVLKHVNPRLLKTGRSNFENAVLDLVAEATFLQQLEHPNILSLKGLARGGTDAFRGGTYDSYFIITERLSETLAQRLQRWRKQQKRGTTGGCKTLAGNLYTKCQYALQIADAIRCLHQQRLIYRDLKPDNIGFKEEDDTLQLFDFGLCRQLPKSNSMDGDDIFRMSGGVGTRRYCAVEICRHQPYNAKADVYSWAMVFWELLTLQKPFADFTKEDHFKFVCELGGTPNLSRQSPDTIPPTIQALLRNAWARDVSKRWTMAHAHDALKEIIRTEQQQPPTDGLLSLQSQLQQQKRQSSFTWRGTRRRSSSILAG